MSASSDEELVGDVDCFDVDLGFIDPSERKKQIVGALEKLKGEGPNPKIVKQTPKTLVSKPQAVKRKPAVTLDSSSDLLQAFTTGISTSVAAKKTNTVQSGDKKQDVKKATPKQNVISEKPELVLSKANAASKKAETVTTTATKEIRKELDSKPVVGSLVISENTKSQTDGKTIEKGNQSKPSAGKQSLVTCDIQPKQDQKQQNPPKPVVSKSKGIEADPPCAASESKSKQEVLKPLQANTDTPSISRLSTENTSKDPTTTSSNSEHVTSSSLKRKAEEPPKATTVSAKVVKPDTVGSDVEMVQADGNETDQQEPENVVVHTKEELKSMDQYLTDMMFMSVKNHRGARPEMKYKVNVSRLEVSDLCQPTLLHLIQLHPTVTLIFQHQAVKIKKKKGYAEACFSTMTELKEFVYQLTQLKLFERRLEVKITASRPTEPPDVLSFVIHLNRNTKLLQMIDSGEDPKINVPLPLSDKNLAKTDFEKVPSSVSPALLHSLFPFNNNVSITRSNIPSNPTPELKGPLSVFFVNQQWMDAVMECCSDFSVNEFPLKQVPNTSDKKSKEQHRASGKRKKGNQGDNPAVDDLVASMTRDVCSDMLQSIEKLKELESDNPNLKRILDMQEKLNTLQESLSSDAMQAVLSEQDQKQRDIEQMLEEADKREREKEEELKQKREARRKEEEAKRKSQRTRSLFNDWKQGAVIADKLSPEAERILKQREQRIREREEEQKRQQAAAKRREEELLKRQEEEQLMIREEEKREFEKQRLIREIEEARQRDLQKAEKQSSLMWAASDDESSSRRYGSSSAGGGGKRGRRDQARSEDDGLEDRLSQFARELEEQGKIERQESPLSLARDSSSCRNQRENPSRAHRLTEDQYNFLRSSDLLHTLPSEYEIALTRLTDRTCPVRVCPAKTCFKTRDNFMEHWAIFHQAESTMRFCQQCSAYFIDSRELEHHIMKQHRMPLKDATRLARNARVKVIDNPSYRNPAPYVVL